MQSRKIILSVVVILAALLTSMCTPTTGEPDFAATLISMQLTQTAMVVPPTIAPPPTEPPQPDPTATQPAPPPPQTGSISGILAYPSEGIPPLRVVAFAPDSSSFYIETGPGQNIYSIPNLPPGEYRVVAYTLDGALSGGYSQAVPCGLNVECVDHSLIPVMVVAGQDVPNINPVDWYAPPGVFPPDPTVAQAAGSISGSLSYPSEFIPPLRIVAFEIRSGAFFYIDTAQNQTTYTISGLPPGVYQVVAYVIGMNLAGGYTQAVPCGLTAECTNHTLIPINLNPGDNLTGIDPGDWYAPPGSFPPNPVP
jgi:hypothetical protein